MDYRHANYIKPSLARRIGDLMAAGAMVPFVTVAMLLPIWGLRAMAVSALWALYAPYMHLPPMRLPAALALTILLGVTCQPTFGRATRNSTLTDDILTAMLQSCAAMFIGLIGYAFL